MKEISKLEGTVLSDDEEQLYLSIRRIILNARGNAYAAVNTEHVRSCWEVGRSIVEDEQGGEARGKYGKGVLNDVSARLTAEFGSGYSARNLRHMRRFYLSYPNWNAVRSELTWSHYRALIKVEDSAARTWYEGEAIASQWSSRQLERQIQTFYYQRLLASRDKNPVIAEAKEKLAKVEPEEFIKNPYVLEFAGLKDYPAIHESDLEQALISNLESFLLELGRGFCFVARQKLMRYDDEDFYIDLVFYHSILKCYVLIDLKMGKLSHGDVGQMDSYIRMFDDLQRADDDNPTIGLILCSEENEAIAKYSVLAEGKQLFASKYQFTLPTAGELESRVQSDRRRIERQMAEGREG